MKENLKEILEAIVEDLESQGVNLYDTPALFKWRYPENDVVKYQLMIGKSHPSEDGEGEDYVH